jgi:hypothetical protein
MRGRCCALTYSKMFARQPHDDDEDEEITSSA